MYFQLINYVFENNVNVIKIKETPLLQTNKYMFSFITLDKKYHSIYNNKTDCIFICNIYNLINITVNLLFFIL